MTSSSSLTVGESCDTFVFFGKTPTKSNPSGGGEGERCVVFGKNSDRPAGESQEVVFVNAADHDRGSTVQCTYIAVPQSPRTLAVLLSKPAWMWGAEMGSNERGVVIGNEAVWDRLIDPPEDLTPRLLGMDLLRLGLERGESAADALDVITGLLERFGQGGSCSDVIEDFSYHNSFLIADAKEAWVLETAGRWWVAERVTDGWRNISNCMSIGTKIDRIHPGLKAHAVSSGWWQEGEGPFDWTRIISNDVMQQIGSGPERFVCGKRLLENMGKQKDTFLPQFMMEILRNEEGGICRPYDDESGFPTCGSQVSLLLPGRQLHWFTATSDPQRALFKPTPSFDYLKRRNEVLSSHTASRRPFPDKVEDSCGERSHDLWRMFQEHKKVKSSARKDELIENIEKELLGRVSASLLTLTKMEEETNVFDEAVKMEMDAYRKASGSKL